MQKQARFSLRNEHPSKISLHRNGHPSFLRVGLAQLTPIGAMHFPSTNSFIRKSLQNRSRTAQRGSNKASKSKGIIAVQIPLDGDQRLSKHRSTHTQAKDSSSIRLHTLWQLRQSSTIHNTNLFYQVRQEGNNSNLIDKLLADRKWNKLQVRSNIGSHKKRREEPKFIWGSVIPSRAAKLSRAQMVSRLPGGRQMTDKGRLHDNLLKYCDRYGISTAFLPLTFTFSMQSLSRSSIQQFMELFNHIAVNTSLANAWIFKPSNLNQGRQIHLFASIGRLKELLGGKAQEHQSEEEQHLKKNKLCSIKFITGRLKMTKEIHPIISQQRQTIQSQNSDLSIKLYQLLQKWLSFQPNRSLILQKYIQNPFILFGRKFDIRMWVLVDHYGKFYLYRQGYLRFSSQPYKLTSNTLKDNFVHLTNHALQKHSSHYNKQKNLMRMQIMKSAIIDRKGEQGYLQVIQQMQKIVCITIQATLAKSIRQEVRYRNFQIFGFDFLLDREFNVRLIEANTNPSITQDAPFLSELIPKMINEAFKLTIDKQFGCQSTKIYSYGEIGDQNGWKQLGRIGDDEQMSSYLF